MSAPLAVALRVLAVFCSGLITTQLAGAGELRTLTDKSGRTIRAELVSLDGDRLKIRREDGQEFTLALSSLSEPDQNAVKKWTQQSNQAAPKVTFSCSRRVYPAKKDEIDVTNSFGAVQKAAATRVQEMAGYDIVVKNESARQIESLVVSYVVLARPVGESTARLTPTGLNRQSAAHYTSIGGGKTLTVQAMISVETKVKFKPKFGPPLPLLEDSRRTLYGIWVKVYAEGVFVGEFAVPENLPATEEWPLG